MDLPNDLKYSIEQLAVGVPHGKLLETSADISSKYKNESGQGKRLVKEKAETIVYAIVRMPATYGAVSSAIKYLLEMVDSANIKTVLDVGSGTGTAVWAAYECIPGIETVTCLEREPEMIEIAKTLMQSMPLKDKVTWLQGDMSTFDFSGQYDLVIASYSLNELAEADRMKLIEKLWSCTNQYLLIVEPGTPTAFEHMKIIRECLIRQGASVVAPCPHNAECPLPAGDWCHFTSRVSRTKLHKLLKGGEAPFEDEKYSYLVFSRAQSGKKKSRILRHPVIDSGRITLQLCTQSSSIETRAITKKDKALFKTARKSKCGDTFL